jgi:hypothetical protein
MTFAWIQTHTAKDGKSIGNMGTFMGGQFRLN